MKIFWNSVWASFLCLVSSGHGSIGKYGENLVKRVNEELQKNNYLKNKTKRNIGYTIGGTLGFTTYLASFLTTGYGSLIEEEIRKYAQKRKGKTKSPHS